MADEPIDLSAGVALADIPADGTLAAQLDGAQLMLARWTDATGREHVSALDAICTHSGAKLPTGIRTGDTVHCPFHHACFDLRTGEATVAPAYKPLKRWQADIDGDTVHVRDAAPEDEPALREAADSGTAESGPLPGTPERVENLRGVERVVVVGGGAAGFATVERLRRAAYTGAITLVSGEPHLPIDRTLLSKGYLDGSAEASKLPLLPDDWYAAHDVDARIGVHATAIDTAERIVTLDSGAEVGYDALVLATGATPARPELPGFDRDDAFVLRGQQDAQAIIAAAQSVASEAAGSGAKRVIVVGSGFIGLEVAAAMRTRKVAVTVVSRSELPLARQLGADLAGLVKSLHEEQGVEFVTGSPASWDGAVLELEDGGTVHGDLIVVGLGVSPNTELAEAAGLPVTDGVVVDAYGETTVRGVFAAGDIARFPDPVTGRLIRVEHWAQAERAGALAAINLLGGQEPLTEPPFFWSKHYSTSLRMAGHAESVEDAEVEGSTAEKSAVVRFTEQGRVTAIAGVGQDRRVLELEEELLRQPAGA
ncbi:FAD-dependent oxidoreductase [uncultured Amnibacterium sp.]|uniref:FAD-dependent oxidoreductase n=1 Tax=uncultured Amnibacterium sp. TaxID=1631851 RepID=UPI0035CB8FC8